MKIAFIGSRFVGPYGGERHTIKLANELAKLGHEITLYIPKSNEVCSKLISDNVKLVETGSYEFGTHNMRTVFTLFSMKKLVSKFDPNVDVVNAFGWQAAYAASMIKEKYNLPTVYSVLDPLKCSYDRRSDILNEMGFPQNIFAVPVLDYLKKVDTKSILSADVVISNGEWPTKQLKKVYSIDPLTIYPGVEVDRFGQFTKDESRRKLSVEFDTRLFLVVSKLHPRKNIKESLDIYKKMHDSKSKLVIIGNGPDRSSLETYVKNNQINDVEFLGVQSDDMVTLYYIAADYFLFTSKNEPFGIAPLEAKSAGCEILGIDTDYPIITWKEHAEKVMSVYESILKSDNV